MKNKESRTFDNLVFAMNLLKKICGRFKLKDTIGFRIKRKHFKIIRDE